MPTTTMKCACRIVISILLLLRVLGARGSVNVYVQDTVYSCLISSILDYYSKVPQERIYLQTDRSYYMAGDRSEERR